MASLTSLFLTFAKIGAFTIGGGYAMIPIIEREVVDKHHWIEKEDFLDLLVIAQTAPGILAVNMAILVGNKIRGWKGAVVSAFSAALPSFIIILCFAMFLSQYKDSPLFVKIFKAVRPAVVALIAVPVFNLAKTAKVTWKTCWIPIVAALAIWQFGISPILIIIVAGVAGALGALIEKRKTTQQK
ncbi:MAG: chromate transporter [Bacteroidales bacterium]|nr:chromate transporter [Bacteroidales bacterium]